MRFSSLFRFGLGKGRTSASKSGAPNCEELGFPLLVTQNSCGLVSSSFGDPKTLGDFQRSDFKDRVFMDRIHLLDRVNYLQALDDACNNGQSSCVDIRVRSKGNENGGWTWLACHVAPHRVEEDAFVFARVRYENISRTKQIEADFVQTRDALEAVRADHAHMVSQLGHQLGNSLQVILGNAEMLGMESDKLGDRLNHIISAAQELNFLADEIRQSDQTSATIDTSNTDEFEWIDLINEVVVATSLLAKKRDVSITMDVQPSLPVATIERQSTNLVMSNIFKELVSVCGKDTKLSITSRQYGPKIKIEFSHDASVALKECLDENFFLQSALKKLGGNLSTNISNKRQQTTLMLPLKSKSTSPNSSMARDLSDRQGQVSVDNKGEYRARLSA